MPMLHDPAVRRSIEARLDTIRPDSPRQWGRMSVDQMLWHLNEFLAASLGEETTLSTMKSRVPGPLVPVVQFLVLHMPWPKSARTNKGAVATREHDLEGERLRCRELIARFVSRPVDGEWPVDPSWGPVNGRWASRMMTKHLDHHFRQFSA